VKTRILLVDDQTLVRQGIASLLRLSPQFEVIKELEDGTDVLATIDSLKPDIVLLDIRMPKLSGLGVLSQMKTQGLDTPCLILTTFDEHELVLDCIKLGAKGYLRKDVNLEILTKAIEYLIAGKTWFQPAHNHKLEIKTAAHLNSPITEPLTVSELEVLRLVAAGYSNAEIADALYKSSGTIRNKVSTILAKLQVRDRTRAVLKAMEYNLIQ